MSKTVGIYLLLYVLSRGGYNNNCDVNYVHDVYNLYEYFGHQFVHYFACDQGTLKGGGDDVSDIFGRLMLRVPLRFKNGPGMVIWQQSTLW